MCGFIAQLVEQRTGNAGVTDSNPVEALIFFRLLSNCLNWKIYCDDHSSLSSTTAVQNELFHTPHGRHELNKLTLLPMCGFIAQLVEQRTGNAGVTGSNPVEALIFFRLLLSNCLIWKIYCNDHSSLSLCNYVCLFVCCCFWVVWSTSPGLVGLSVKPGFHMIDTIYIYICLDL